MRSYLITGIAVISIAISSCDKDPQLQNPEELITTLVYRLTPVGGGDHREFTFRDTDGDGGLPPVITADTLSANTVYDGIVYLFNESVTPSEIISEEISDESEDHQFFYSVTGLHAQANYADTDDDGNPLGLLTTFTTLEAGQGSLQIILRHLPDKNAPGVKDGVLTNAGGETDIDITFPLVIE